MLQGVLFTWVSICQSDTEETITYTYDTSGNIVRLDSVQQSEPSISGINPNFLNAGQANSFIISGENLLGGQISFDSSELNVISTDNSSIDTLRFSARASPQAIAEEITLEVTTGAGIASTPFFIGDLLPELTTSPENIFIASSGGATSLLFRFEEPRLIDETYDVQFSDGSLASSDSATLTFLAGEQEAVLNISGLGTGVFFVSLARNDLRISFNFPVSVIPTYQEYLSTLDIEFCSADMDLPGDLPGGGTDFPDGTPCVLFSDESVLIALGDRAFREDGTEVFPDELDLELDLVGLGSLEGGVCSNIIPTIGILLPPDDSCIDLGEFTADNLFSKPVGVFFGDQPPASVYGAPTGVYVGSEFHGRSVGTQVGVSVGGIQPTLSALSEVIVGPLINMFTPSTLSSDSVTIINLVGENLDLIDSISVSGTQGNVVTASFLGSGNSTSRQIMIDVGVNARGTAVLNLKSGSIDVFTREGARPSLVIDP